jgi:putative FmdB family regulatory protein
MPTYNYRCDACQAEFEKEQRISEAPVKKCVKCGKNKARRMIVSGNFILKGGGWYSDGYGKGKSPAKPEADAKGTGEDKAQDKAQDKVKDKVKDKSKDGASGKSDSSAPASSD